MYDLWKFDGNVCFLFHRVYRGRYILIEQFGWIADITFMFWFRRVAHVGFCSNILLVVIVFVYSAHVKLALLDVDCLHRNGKTCKNLGVEIIFAVS